MNNKEAFQNQGILRDPYLADRQREIIINLIKNFQDSLDSEHEVGVSLANFGTETPMVVTNIGFSNPMLIMFYGTVNGAKSELIQHIGQINFLLAAVPKSNPNKPARRIGFTLSNGNAG